MNARDELVEELVCQCLQARTDDDPTALERVLAAHPPELRNQVAAMLGTLDRVGLVGPATRHPDDAGAVAFGPYLLLERLGAGSMGVVYRVRDPAGAERALKLLQPALRPMRRARERFEREVQALRALDHPGICRLLEAGEVDGVPFLLMPLLSGESLHARFARGLERTAAERDWLLALVEQIATALHHAHERGFVHRDVKPANVLIGTDGRPVLLDFGLARLDRDDAVSLSQTHEVIGAPAYMAPEQIADGSNVDRRADVYALGVVLYEGMTGCCPYEATTRESLYRRILGGDAAAPSRRIPGIPAWLDVVCLTAMARDRGRRYQTVAALAADIARVRAGQRPLAQLPGPFERTRRWVTRNPLPTTLLVLLVLAVVAAVRQTLWQQRASARDRARVLAAEAFEVLPADPRRAEGIALAAYALAPDVLEASTAIEAARAAPREQFVLAGHTQPVVHLEFDAGGERIVSASLDGTARLWHPCNATFVPLPHGGDGPALATVHPDGGTVATGGRADGRVCLWGAERGELRWQRTAHAAGAVRVLRWSPDGNWLLSAGAGGARLWSTAGEERELASTLHTVTVGEWLAPDVLALGTGDDGVPGGETMHWLRSFRVTTQSIEPLASRELPDAVTALRPRPDDAARLLALGASGNAYLWRADSGELQQLAAVHVLGTQDVAWSADGRQAMALAINGRLAYFDPDGARRGSVHTLPWATVLMPHPFRRYAAVSGGNGIVQLRCFDGTGGLLFGRRRLRPLPIGFSPDGQWFAATDWQHAIRVWPTWRDQYPMFYAGDMVEGAVWSTDGRRIVTGSYRASYGTPGGGAVHSWDTATGQLLDTIQLDTPVNALARGPAGDVIAVHGSGLSGGARVVANADGELRHDGAAVSAPGLCNSVDGEVLADGRVVLLQEENRVVACDLAANTIEVCVETLPPERNLHRGYSLAVAARRDGATLWHGGTSGLLHRVDRTVDGSYTPGITRELGQNIRTIEVVDDGSLLIGGANGLLERHLLDGSTVDFAGHRDDVAAVDWTRVTGELVVASGDFSGTVRLWRGDGTALREIHAHVDDVWSVCFSPCGRRVLTGSRDGTARIWPVTFAVSH